MSDPQVVAALRSLAGRLAALEQQASSASEPLTPSYQTYDPASGRVGANFTGQVHAQGLILDAAGSSTPVTNDRIRWIRTGDGALVADLGAWQTAHHGTVALSAYDPTDLNTSAGFSAQADATLGSSAAASAQTQGVTVIDSLGESSFLQLLATQKLRLSFGTGTVTFTASQSSAQGTIAHGLNAVPKFVACFPNGWFGFLVENGGAPFDNTNFYPIGWSPNTLNGQQGFYWIAIG